MTFYGNTGPMRALNGAITPTRSQQLQMRSGGYAPYSNPFFDQASTFMPKDIKALFAYTRNYFLTHGVINAVTTTVSEYPITPILLTDTNEEVTNRWDTFLRERLQYHLHQLRANLDYNVYGISFASPSFPFKKTLTCGTCRAEHDAVQKRQYWQFSSFRFRLTCTKCGQTDYVKDDDVHDHYYPTEAGVGIVHWNPEYIDAYYNETTGRTEYTYSLPPSTQQDIVMGRKDLVATTPKIFIEAAKAQRPLVFDDEMVFVMIRPGPSSMFRGWGVPLSFPVLKDTFYVQIMKKAQEVVLQQYLLPQVFLYPQPSTGSADPYITANLGDWRSHIQRELVRMRQDPGYYGIVPFPIGHQTIGENGRSLMLVPEIEKMSEQIIIGMGFAPDILTGGGTYAGNTVSMRMLENKFVPNILQQHRMLKWVMRKFGQYLHWEVPKATFKPFKMADDLQRVQLLTQLQQGGVVSKDAVLGHLDLNSRKEAAQILEEAKDTLKISKQMAMMQAESQGEAALITAKYNAQAQVQGNLHLAREQQQKADPFSSAVSSPLNNAGITVEEAVRALARTLHSLPPAEAEAIRRQVTVDIPEMHDMLAQAQQQMAAADPTAMQQGLNQVPPTQPIGVGAAPAVDMRQLPEQLPPRRQ